MNASELLKKYDVPGPRYTSYPTVPHWNETPPTQADWQAAVVNAFCNGNPSEGISLYIHLPYCESLCTYCGCNTRITVNHKVERPYIESVLKEWKRYLEIFPGKPRIRELHLGGGTPSFFSPENLEYLINGLLAGSEVCSDHEFGFEAHPNYTSVSHLQTLYTLGFRRVSYGIQDFDPKVQEVVNRVQTYEQVEKVTQAAREIGYESINYDLIYGLPFQTTQSVSGTIEKVKKLLPDRIAFYSYAHVPWIKPGQRRFTEMDLPSGSEKRELYELGLQLLEDAGYLEIGMDHFALKEDGLYHAFQSGTLHRNFMGYTPFRTRLMIGLGCSSISDADGTFVQNRKIVEQYKEALEGEGFPFFRGHLPSASDRVIREHILNLMCRLTTSWENPGMQHPDFLDGLLRMNRLEADGLVVRKENSLSVTKAGNAFLRNVCMALDPNLAGDKKREGVFSRTV